MRVLTGIPGFDEITSGGLLKGRTYLVLGGPGAGKTIFSLQYICNGAISYDEPGIYVTLEESVESIVTTAKSLGWDIDSLQAEGKVRIIDASPYYSPVVATKYAIRTESVLGEAEFEINSVIDIINKSIIELGATRLVIDALTPLIIQYKTLFEARMKILSLIKALKELEGVTSLITAEVIPPNWESTLFGIERYVVDGVIMLYYIRVRGERIRGVEVVKLRGSPHSHSIHPFKITPKGIIIYPKEKLTWDEERIL